MNASLSRSYPASHAAPCSFLYWTGRRWPSAQAPDAHKGNPGGVPGPVLAHPGLALVTTWGVNLQVQASLTVSLSVTAFQVSHNNFFF